MDLDEDPFFLNYDTVEFNLDDPRSPLVHESLHLSTNLSIPLHDHDPSPLQFDEFGFGDSQSLSVPMRENPQMFQQNAEPPRLSPPMSSYQSMNAISSYEMQSLQLDPTQQQQTSQASYNSFEQPVEVVNGGYEAPLLEADNSYYANEQPSTSTQAQTQSTQHMHTVVQQHTLQQQSHSHTQMRVVTTSAQRPPVQSSPAAQNQRNRPIQPKSNKKKTNTNPNSVGEVLSNRLGNQQKEEVRVSPEAMQRIAAIQAEIGQLQEQAKLGIDNSNRITELQNQIPQLILQFASTIPANIVTASQPQQQQFQQKAPAPPRPRSRKPPQSQAQQLQQQAQVQSQAQHQQQQEPQQFIQHQFVDQHQQQQQPQQIIISSQPSTSQAPMYGEYVQNGTSVPVVISGGQTIQVQQPQQRQMYRVVNQVPVSSQQSYLQQPVQQGQTQHVYVQQVPTSVQITNAGPTVGQVIRQQQHSMRNAKNRQQQQIVIQQHQQVQQVVMNSPLPHAPAPVAVEQAQPVQLKIQPPIPVIPRPPKPNPAQVAKKMQEKRKERRDRLQEGLQNLYSAAANPETEVPFKDQRDVLRRLLAYHQYNIPELNEEENEQFDSNYLRHMINLYERKNKIERRMRHILCNEAARGREKEENNMYLFLDGEYERRKLEDEKTFVNDDTRESFVNSSDIVRLYRERGEEPIASTSQAQPTKSNVKHGLHLYEYHNFVEEIRVISPYKSPSPPPVKSPSSCSSRRSSPMKSPNGFPFLSPRSRPRSSNSTSSTSSIPVLPPSPIKSLLSRKVKEEVPASPEKPLLESRAIMSPKTTMRTPKFRPSTTELQTALEEKRVDSPRNPLIAPSPSAPPVVAEVKKELVKPPVPRPLKHRVNEKLNIKEEVVDREPTKAATVANHTPPPVRARKTSDRRSRVLSVSDEPKAPSPRPVPPPVPQNLLPMKKRLLSRVRNDIPPALRSPPAQTMRQPPAPVVNGVESEGDASPELGIDDVCPPSSSIAARTHKEITPARLPSPLNEIASLPPPQPYIAKAADKGDAHLPLLRRFKHQVPRPAPLSDSSSGKREGKEKEPTGTLAESSKPKLMLKLKIGPDYSMTVAGNGGNIENLPENDRKHKHHKKKKKKKRDHREREERRQKRTEKRLIDSGDCEEFIVKPNEGPVKMLKIRFNRSRTSTPVVPSEPEYSRPSSSGTVEAAIPAPTPTPPPAKVPRLKIRFGNQTPEAVPVQAEVIAVITPPESNSSKMNVGSLAPVDFSDDSDGETERLRASTDDALRSCGLTGLGMSALNSNAPLLPWSSNS